MSQIQVVINPNTGRVIETQVIGDNEEENLEAIDKLKIFLPEINKFAKSLREVFLRQRIYGGKT